MIRLHRFVEARAPTTPRALIRYNDELAATVIRLRSLWPVIHRAGQPSESLNHMIATRCNG